jgi:hypothetical protein
MLIMPVEMVLDLNGLNNLNILIPSSKQGRSQTFANEILEEGVSTNLWRKLCTII